MKNKQAIQGILLALGAPLGWLALRWSTGSPPWREIVEQPGLYAYLSVSTIVVFAAFGWLLGQRQARLDRLVVRLNEQTLTDPLTGLRNRRYFFERLQELCDRTSRLDRPFSVAILDLDRFKQLNDRFGHLAGDRVLRGVSKVLASNVRRSELVARIGGEEFGLLVPDGDERQGLAALERIRRALQAEVGVAAGLPGEVAVTVSAGVVSSAQLGPDLDLSRLMTAADEALYRAKDLGRNRIELWTGRPDRATTPDVVQAR